MLALSVVCLAYCSSSSPPKAIVEGDDEGGAGSPFDGSATDAGPSAPEGSEPADAGEASAIDAAPSGSATPCGSVSMTRGQAMAQSVMVGSVERTYLVYLPKSASATVPLPFVYLFHGAQNSGQAMFDVTQYALLAESEGIALVFPDGETGPNAPSPVPGPWNIYNQGQIVCGAGEFSSNSGDDFGFMDAMKSAVLPFQCLDTAHVFATGHSMGGYFTHHIGCYRADIRAIGPASGGTIDDLSVCTTGHVPVIIFHGTADPTISPSCSDPHGSGTGATQSAFTASATLWAQKNGCKTTYQTIPNKGASGAMATGQCYVYDGCPADGQVELCTFNGMGHDWAGGSSGTSNFGAPDYASATQLEWAFFKAHAW